MFDTTSESLVRGGCKSPGSQSPGAGPARATLERADDPFTEGEASSVALEGIWDAFELDAFGGPEAEPEPEYGDFCHERDDLGWEGGWR